jgi:general secretion pathway protein G
VDTGYLRGIPKDPFTGATTTWQEISDPVEKGVIDVFSGAEFVGTDGTPYNRW